MRLLPILTGLVMIGCTAVTTTTPADPQAFERDEFGYVVLPDALLQTSMKITQPPPTVEGSSELPPLVKTKRRSLKTVEESEDPELIEERKRKKPPTRFVPYEGPDPYQAPESGPEPISTYALTLAQRNIVPVSREQEPVDGSSFVRKVLYSTHVGMLPRGADKQAKTLASSTAFESVPIENLRPGDLVFWKGLNQVGASEEPSHVGIYVGEMTAVTQWPGRGILKLRLEGILGPPQLAQAYRYRGGSAEDFRALNSEPASPPAKSSTKPTQALR